MRGIYEPMGEAMITIKVDRYRESLNPFSYPHIYFWTVKDSRRVSEGCTYTLWGAKREAARAIKKFQSLDIPIETVYQGQQSSNPPQ